MVRLLIVGLLLGLCRLVYAAEANAGAAEAKAIASSVTEVTVYADRAQVVRTAAIDLPAEITSFTFARLPGWIDESSIRVGLVPATAGELLDVQVLRTFLARATDEEFRKGEDAVREISDQIAALDDEQKILDQQIKQIEAIRVFSLEKLPKDVAVREIKPSEYGETVEFIANAQRKVAAAKRELDRKRRELQPELSARQKTFQDLQQRAQLEQRSVVATCRASAAGKATLRLTYMLPGATWEPVHEVRATAEAKPVSLSSYAVVSQTSGEDWTGVRLFLSTQRSTETLKIPELEALLVGTGRRVARIVSASASSFAAARKNYEQQSGVWNTINNREAGAQQAFLHGQIAQLDNEKKVEQLFATLQQRGTTAHFPSLGPQSIRTDGRQVRVPLGVRELDAQYRIIAAPEVSLNAARTVDLANTSKQSLLPGKISIYLEGAFLGFTETEFVAPGESFALYLGVADQIKLTRTLDKKRSELKSGGSKTKMQVSFVTTVENLSDSGQTVHLTERIPVSQMDEVRVSGIHIQPEGRPDVKGLLNWKVNLPAHQSRDFRIEYSLEYPTQLPKQANLPGYGAEGIQLHEQIKSLELELKK